MSDEYPILVDFSEQSGLIKAGFKPDVAKWLEQSKESLDKAMIVIVGMANRAAELQESIPTEFTQAEIEFGVKLNIESGALLAKTSAEGSLSVKLTWERKDKKEES